MTTTNENGLTIVRHETDRMTSVYRGVTFLGSALPNLRGFDILGWSASGPFKDRVECATEQAAIDYLAGEGVQ